MGIGVLQNFQKLWNVFNTKNVHHQKDDTNHYVYGQNITSTIESIGKVVLKYKMAN